MRLLAILTSLVVAGTSVTGPAGLVWAQSAPSGADMARGDAVITEMAQAYQAHDRKRLGRLLPEAQGHPLEPWAAYWELSARLDEADSADVQGYFGRYAGTYQEDRLRVEWLQLLGHKRDWAAFAREWPKYRMNDDKAVLCYHLLSEHLTNRADVTDALEQAWLSVREADEACSSAAAQLLSEHVLPERVVWQRARQAVEYDRPAVAMQAVGMLDEQWAKTLQSLYANPQRYLKENRNPLRPHTRELAVLALLRQAYLDPDVAARALEHPRWRALLKPEVRSWLWGAIGRRAALKQSDAAPGFFNQGQFTEMHPEHLAWAVRAALRAQDWRMVLRATDAMAPQQRADSCWTYWRARAELALARGEQQRASALRALSGLAGVYGFYEQLALEDTGTPVAVPAPPPPPTPRELESARNNAGLQRALYAIGLGLRTEGVREWNYTTNLAQSGGMDDRALLAAAELACQAEVWDRCIAASERTRAAFNTAQRFPMPFRADVVAQAERIGLDPAYVYGLIRQESRFIMNARSSVGASGLMQIMPKTARWTARKIGLTDFQPEQLNRRDVNITIGTSYLKLLLDNFGGSVPLATAAYNAGPNRSRTWRGGPGAPQVEGAVWAENIPFNETRDYVKKVISNTAFYAAILTGQPQSIRARLPAVGPRQSDTPETGADLP